MASAPASGTTTPDARNNLRNPTALLPAPDGGIVIVSSTAATIFTWISKSGELKPFITTTYPTYDDEGRAPGKPTSAYQDAPSSAIITTVNGEIVRVSDSHATLLGNLPRKSSANIVSGDRNQMLIQQDDATYLAKINGTSLRMSKLSLKGIPHNYRVFTSSERSSHLASDGRHVMSVNEDGKVNWRAQVATEATITAVASDSDGGAWVGDTYGGIFHIRPSGKIETVSSSGRFGLACRSTAQKGPPITEINAMIVIARQLYIADANCGRITAFGM